MSASLHSRAPAIGSRSADSYRNRGSAVPRVEIEAEYARARLRGQRTLIRAACTFAALFAVLRGTEQALVGFWHPGQPMALSFVIATSVILALVVWTRAFEHIYLPLANLLVPARNAVATVFVVGAAAGGQQEALMLLPLMAIGPFFFLGFGWRAALICGIVTFVSFGVGAVAFGLELPVALRAGALAGLSVAACTIAARHYERLARGDFAESRRVSERAQHDPLTGLKNRGVFDERLATLWRRAIEMECAISILLIDVDHFKRFNDRHGHQAGDRALQGVAQTLERLIERPLDVLTRYGGEEFAAILYDVDARQAEAVAERMRRAAKAHEAGPRKQDTAPVTISIGVSLVEPSDGRQPIGAVQLADQALYEAKRRGRDCVVLLDQTAHLLLETGVFDLAMAERESADPLTTRVGQGPPKFAARSRST